MSSGSLVVSAMQEELQARLADPRTLGALNRLLDRLDLVAASVEMMDSFLRRSSDIADNVADSVSTLRDAPGGGDFENLIGKLPSLARAGAKVADVADSPAFDRLLRSDLLERLSSARTLDAITALLDKLPLLVFTVQALEEFWKRGDEVANSIAESVADLRNLKSPEVAGALEHLPQIASATVQLSEIAATPEFGNLLALSKDLGKPEVVAKARYLLEKLDLAVFAVGAIEGFFQRGDQVADSVAEGLTDLKKLVGAVNLEELNRIALELPKLTEASRQLVASGLLEKVSELAEAGMVLSNAGLFEPGVVRPLAEVGRLAMESYTAAKDSPARRYSFFDLLRLMKDPETGKAIHLMIETSRQLGKRLT